MPLWFAPKIFPFGTVTELEVHLCPLATKQMTFTTSPSLGVLLVATFVVLTVSTRKHLSLVAVVLQQRSRKNPLKACPQGVDVSPDTLSSFPSQHVNLHKFMLLSIISLEL